MGVKIDTLKCTGCGACIYVCPFGVLSIEDMKCRVGECCTSCGLCVDRCTWQAITLEGKHRVSKRGGAPLSLKSPSLHRRRGGQRGKVNKTKCQNL